MKAYKDITVKKFDNASLLGNDVTVYFSDTEDYSLINIPAWNWCYLWEVSKDEALAKEECIKALSIPMFEDDAIQLTQRIYEYLLRN